MHSGIPMERPSSSRPDSDHLGSDHLGSGHLGSGVCVLELELGVVCSVAVVLVV